MDKRLDYKQSRILRRRCERLPLEPGWNLADRVFALEAGERKRAAYLAMEFLDGVTLKLLIREHPLKADQYLDVADALDE